MSHSISSNNHPHIRSFVRRKGHISEAQKFHVEHSLPKWSIPFKKQSLELNQTHGRNAPVWLEIGFGMGETTATIAKNNTDINYIGVEIFTAGVGSLLKKIEEQAIQNIRIISHDVVEVLEHMIPAQSLDRVMIYFPDPWPKARHHKRRLIQPHFLNLLLPKLKSNAIVHCATDWEHYAEQMLSVLSQCSNLKNMQANGSYSPRPESRPLTKFENRGLKLGHGVWDLIFQKFP